MKDRLRGRWIVGPMIGWALFLAACGANTGGSAEDEGPVTLRVGVIPIADVAPLYLGMKKGFFEEERLSIEPQLAEGGAAILPPVLSGDFQVGFSNTTSLIIASTEGLPVEIISQGVLGGSSEEDAWDAVLVRKNSSIRSPSDLEGKTIAVNTLQNIGPLTINTALEKEGANYRTVKYIEVPFPDMNPALDEGRVDAVWVVEPFVTQGTSGGARAILFPYEQAIPDLTVATYFASKQYIEQNGDVVDRFVSAMNRSLEYASENEEEVRDIVLDYTEIPPEAADAMALPQWRSDLNLPTIEETAQLAERYGFIEEQPDFDDLIQSE